MTVQLYVYLKYGAVTGSQLRKLSLQIVPVFEKFGFVLLVECVPVCSSVGIQFA